MTGNKLGTTNSIECGCGSRIKSRGFKPGSDQQIEATLREEFFALIRVSAITCGCHFEEDLRQLPGHRALFRSVRLEELEEGGVNFFSGLVLHPVTTVGNA